MARIFGQCLVCGNLVVRKPGNRYGDGQVDSDTNQIWLLTDEEEIKEAGVTNVEWNLVRCGCNDH